MRAWLVAVLCSVPAVAAAGDLQFESAGPDGLTIEGDYTTVYVRDGHLRAPILQARGESAELTHGGVTVHSTQNMCGAERDDVFTVDQLRAHLANVRGYHAHQRGLYQAAMVDFAHAVELDPTYFTAATNLASAQVLVGRRRAAIVTLAPWLRNDPVRTYIKIATDPELAPLLSEPEVTALEVRDQIDPVGESVTLDAAFSPRHHLVVRGNRLVRQGMSATNGSIDMFDTHTGRRVVELALDSDDAIAAADHIVHGLGFTPVALVEGKSRNLDPSFIIERASDETRVGVRVDLGDVGLVERDGVIRAFRHDTQIGEDYAIGHFHGDASYIPAANAVFIETSTSCADSDESHEQIMLLKTPS